MINLNEIGLKHPINMGAPAPKILADDNNLILLFYLDLFDSPKISDKLKEREIENDTGIAIIKFKRKFIHKFGAPNDDLIIGHPYYKIGLKPYSFYSVEDSDWIKEIIRIQSLHPYYNEESVKNLNHYILTFKDNTFECIADEYFVEYSYETMSQCIQLCLKNMESNPF